MLTNSKSTAENTIHSDRYTSIRAMFLIALVATFVPSENFAFQSDEKFTKRELAYLGVGLAFHTPAEEISLGLSPKAVVVSTVFPETPAAEMGLQIGDVIQAINGTPLSDSLALETHIHSLAIGAKVTLSINRQGNLIQKETQLISEPENVLLLSFRDAAQGNPHSQYLIGLHYLRGSWIDRNPEKAHYWLQRAAEGGVGMAYAALAEIYETGDGASPRTS